MAMADISIDMDKNNSLSKELGGFVQPWRNKPTWKLDPRTLQIKNKL